VRLRALAHPRPGVIAWHRMAKVGPFACQVEASVVGQCRSNVLGPRLSVDNMEG
jgi:hypothetical protein